MEQSFPDIWKESGILTVLGLVQRHAVGAPDSIALLADGRAPLSYAGLLQQIQSTAEFLYTAGIKRADIIAVVLPNGPEMALAFLSVSSAATCAPLNPAYGAAEFEFYLNDLARQGHHRAAGK